jgi:hypothetical protein
MKEWIIYPEVEVLIVPVLDSQIGIGHAQVIFGRSLIGDGITNSENPGGYVTVGAEKDEDCPNIQRSLAVWERPRQIQRQLNRRIFEISSRVGPANNKFAEPLSQSSKEEVSVITLGLAPAESGCFKPRAVVLVRQDRRITLTGKGIRHRTNRLSSQPFGRNSPEKTPSPRLWAPRTFIYPMEIVDIMELVKSGRQNTFPTELEQTGA